MAEKILLAWSGGKDSAMALGELRRSSEFEVAALLVTVTEGYDRVSMHGVRRVLIERQADSLDLPLHEVFIPPECVNETYESRMREALEHWRAAGVRRVAFGDLFLEEVRAYRERNLARLDMQGLFPVWGRNTRELAREFIRESFRAVLVCVDTAQVAAEFAGRIYDEALLRDLPTTADACGENGEFHTFVFDGPLFREPVAFARGELVTRDRFRFCDLTPAASVRPAQASSSKGA
jgi:uncharacterized protein (TIGR00290 family)